MKTLIAFDKGQFTGKTFMLVMQNDLYEKLRIIETIEVQDNMLYKIPANSYFVPAALAKEFLSKPNDVDRYPDSETIEVNI